MFVLWDHLHQLTLFCDFLKNYLKKHIKGFLIHKGHVILFYRAKHTRYPNATFKWTGNSEISDFWVKKKRTLTGFFLKGQLGIPSPKLWHLSRAPNFRNEDHWRRDLISFFPSSHLSWKHHKPVLISDLIFDIYHRTPFFSAFNFPLEWLNETDFRFLGLQTGELYWPRDDDDRTHAYTKWVCSVVKKNTLAPL